MTRFTFPGYLRYHGIDSCGAAGRKVTGQQGDGDYGERGFPDGEGVMGFQVEQQAFHQAAGGKSQRESGAGSEKSERQGFAQHDPNHVAALCAQGDPNAEFVGAPRDGVGHDAVDADGREEGGENAEQVDNTATRRWFCVQESTASANAATSPAGRLGSTSAIAF